MWLRGKDSVYLHVKEIKFNLKQIVMETIGLLNHRKLLNGINVGLTKIKLNKKCKVLTISHNGNMGNNIIDSINPNLRFVGIPNIEILKITYPVIEETGSPDYMYVIKFKIQ